MPLCGRTERSDMPAEGCLQSGCGGSRQNSLLGKRLGTRRKAHSGEPVTAARPPGDPNFRRSETAATGCVLRQTQTAAERRHKRETWRALNSQLTTINFPHPPLRKHAKSNTLRRTECNIPSSSSKPKKGLPFPVRPCLAVILKARRSRKHGPTSAKPSHCGWKSRKKTRNAPWRKKAPAILGK